MTKQWDKELSTLLGMVRTLRRWGRLTGVVASAGALASASVLVEACQGHPEPTPTEPSTLPAPTEPTLTPALEMEPTPALAPEAAPAAGPDASAAAQADAAAQVDAAAQADGSPDADASSSADAAPDAGRPAKAKGRSKARVKRATPTGVQRRRAQEKMGIIYE